MRDFIFTEQAAVICVFRGDGHRTAISGPALVATDRPISFHTEKQNKRIKMTMLCAGKLIYGTGHFLPTK